MDVSEPSPPSPSQPMEAAAAAESPAPASPMDVSEPLSPSPASPANPSEPASPASPVDSNADDGAVDGVIKAVHDDVWSELSSHLDRVWSSGIEKREGYDDLIETFFKMAAKNVLAYASFEREESEAKEGDESEEEGGNSDEEDEDEYSDAKNSATRLPTPSKPWKITYDKYLSHLDPDTLQEFNTMDEYYARDIGLVCAPVSYGKTICAAIYTCMLHHLYKLLLDDTPLPVLFVGPLTSTSGALGDIDRIAKAYFDGKDPYVRSVDGVTIPFVKKLDCKASGPLLVPEGDDSNADVMNSGCYIIPTNGLSHVLKSMGWVSVTGTQLDDLVKFAQSAKENDDFGDEDIAKDTVVRVAEFAKMFGAKRKSSKFYYRVPPEWKMMDREIAQFIDFTELEPYRKDRLETANALQNLKHAIEKRASEDDVSTTRSGKKRKSSNVWYGKSILKWLEGILSNAAGDPEQTPLIEHYVTSSFGSVIFDELHMLTGARGDTANGVVSCDEHTKESNLVSFPSGGHLTWLSPFTALVEGQAIAMSATFPEELVDYATSESDDPGPGSLIRNLLRMDDSCVYPIVVDEKKYHKAVEESSKKYPGLEFETHSITHQPQDPDLIPHIKNHSTVPGIDECIELTRAIINSSFAAANGASTDYKSILDVFGIPNAYSDRTKLLAAVCQAIKERTADHGSDPVKQCVMDLVDKAISSKDGERTNLCIVCTDIMGESFLELLSEKYPAAHVVQSINTKRENHQENLDMARKELPDGKEHYILISNTKLNANGVNAIGYDEAIITPVTDGMTLEKWFQTVSRWNRVCEERDPVKIHLLAHETRKGDLLPVHSAYSALCDHVRKCAANGEQLSKKKIKKWMMKIKVTSPPDKKTKPTSEEIIEEKLLQFSPQKTVNALVPVITRLLDRILMDVKLIREEDRKQRELEDKKKRKTPFRKLSALERHRRLKGIPEGVPEEKNGKRKASGDGRPSKRPKSVAEEINGEMEVSHKINSGDAEITKKRKRSKPSSRSSTKRSRNA